jgi:NAD(P)-dependent dehydrogenase (short-subunit alcohol dehydrogenase family)
VWEFSDEDWQTIMDINLTGVFNAARAVMSHMMERKSGSMILTASINGIESSAMSAHYGAAKAGVLSLSRTLAVEMAPYNVRVNAVAPGLIDTKMNSWQGALDVIAGHPGGTMELREKAAGYWGALEESLIPPSAISNAVLYLASDESAHVTGTTAVVDAGHLALAGFNPNPINGGFG